MDRTESANPRQPAKDQESHPAGPSHDFEAQKRIHQQIRNDPDYDDWEYGTEPLPHEAWVPGGPGSAAPPAASPPTP